MVIARQNGNNRSRTSKRKRLALNRHVSRERTKQQRMIVLLKRLTGATLDNLAAATDWQRHTIRGAISGTLRKRLGLAVTSVQSKQGTRYKISM